MKNNRKFKEKDALLREHKTSTLENNEQKRMRRKEALAKAMNKYHDPDIA
jgi:hypothetical protein